MRDKWDANDSSLNFRIFEVVKVLAVARDSKRQRISQIDSQMAPLRNYRFPEPYMDDFLDLISAIDSCRWFAPTGAALFKAPTASQWQKIVDTALRLYAASSIARANAGKEIFPMKAE